MTEVESAWFEATDPRPLLRYLIGTQAPRVQDVPEFPDSRGSDRKLRLFACACYHRIRHVLPHPAARAAVNVAERYADGLASSDEFESAQAEIREMADELEPRWRVSWGAERAALHPTHAALALAGVALWDAPQKAAYYAASNAHLEFASIIGLRAGCREYEYLTTQTAEERAQCGLLREVFGNPFRTVSVDPSWRTSTVEALARGAYNERAFDRLPILADALQDAGCDGDALLSHLRDPSAAHVRGCWALDLVLGKA